jgi:hypothetical protein
MAWGQRWATMKMVLRGRLVWMAGILWGWKARFVVTLIARCSGLTKTWREVGEA